MGPWNVLCPRREFWATLTPSGLPDSSWSPAAPRSRLPYRIAEARTWAGDGDRRSLSGATLKEEGRALRAPFCCVEFSGALPRPREGLTVHCDYAATHADARQ